jgi:IS4 transposase
MDLLTPFKEQWEFLLGMLPRGFDLDQTLRDSGGLKRRRSIVEAKTLLRLALIYGICGLSLRATAAWAQAQDLASLSDVALMKRLRNAATWLGRLLGAKLAERVEGLAPSSLAYRLRVVDATTASVPGSQGTDYRIHLGLDLASLNIDRIEITKAKQGESFTRLAIGPGDLILADRGYAHRRGLAAVRQAEAHFLVRAHWQYLPLEDGQGRRLQLPQLSKQVRGKKVADLDVFTVADESRDLARLPARLIVARKPKQAAEAERRRILREASRKGRQADPSILASASYFLVLTSVPRQELTAQKALELYRLRWQIEMTFKRLKGLLHLGDLPMKDPQLAQSYLCAKLLAALLLEDLTQSFLAFPPSATS